LERLVGERQGEIERGREREAGLSGRVGELERLVGERQEEIDRTGSLLDEARLQLAAVRVEADEALRGLERAAERGRELELEADRLSAELGVVRSALSSERQEVGRLGDEMARLSAVEVELRAQVSERSNESEEKARLIVEREARIDILNREKSAWYEERERWVAEVTGLRTTVECLSSEKRALSEQVEERQRNIDERFRELADCARMIFERDEQIERLNREKSEGAEFREQMNAEVAGLRSQLDVSSSEKRAVQDLLAVSQRNIDERFGELADCARMIIERDNRIEALNGEVETLKGLVERMNRMPLVRLTRCFLRPFRPLFSQRRRAFKRTVRMVRESGYFDAGYYLRNYPDVAKSGMDAVVHYLRHGALEGRNPSERFDTAGYLARYPDVAAERNRLNPLVHFLTHGRAEGREPR
jgi:chromosome segregation ATPase